MNGEQQRRLEAGMAACQLALTGAAPLALVPPGPPGPACEAVDCDGEPQGRSLFCPDHEHEWVGAAELPIDPRKAAGAVRRTGVQLDEGVWVVVRDVYCQQCRLPWDQVRSRPCMPYDPVLRGGPANGVRRRRADDPDELAERP